MKKSVGMVGILAGCVAITVFAQKVEKYETLRQQIAKKEPAFQAEWVRVGQSGTLAEFLELKESKTATDLVSLTPPRHVMDVCVDEGMAPWITMAESGVEEVQAVPGSWVRLAMFFEFDVPGHEQQVDWMISDLKVDPEMSTLPGPGYQTSIRRGFKGASKTLVSGAQIDRTLWVSIPKDAQKGEMTLTISASASGPKNGVAATRMEKSTVKVHIRPDAKPTRENLFCLWQHGVEAGEWLSQYPAGDAGLKKQNQRSVDWVHGWFKQFAANPQLSEAALLKELMADDRYAKFVIPNVAK